MNINPSESSAKWKQASVCECYLSTCKDEENTEQLLRSIYNSVEASIFVVDVLEDGDFRYVALNPTHERWTGIRSEDLKGKTPEEVLSPLDAAMVRQHYTDCVRFGKTISYEQCLQLQGILTWWITTLTPLRDGNTRISRLIGTSTNITERKQAEEALRVQAEREQLLGAIAQHIRQSLDLDTILNRTVTEVRQFLECDRVLIYRFEPDWNGIMVVESTVPPARPLLGTNIQDPCFCEKHIERYRRGRIQVVEDIHTAGLHPCYIDFLASFQVRANLVVPIVSEQDLWGLLIAHHCRGTRQWYQTEIDLLKQLATQVAIAVQQAELHQQVQRLNVQLESQIQKRTAELKQALNFEALVRRITEKIRDSLDETQVLQTATQELAEVLKVERCKIELYNASHTTATVAYEYTTTLLSRQGLTRQVADFPELYQQLLQKQPLQFVKVVQEWNPKLTVMTQLACPIFDDQGILGNLWLAKPTEEAFDEFEMRLVQQVANECAIAIRQARLYETAQGQVRELEKLEHLKNEFLKTLSHELRTPVTSISLAAQTLESLLQDEEVFAHELVPQLLQILHNECERESKLINDLLALTYLEAETEPVTLLLIDLQSWLPSIVEPFRERISCQQQQLNLSIASELPALETDITDLERILTELLNNACKYTPVGESITVSAYATADKVLLSVSNSGVEITADELSRIFEPFYRIPKNDPWKYGGTGLGLALVQKMVRHLGATIHVESAAGKTTFTLWFPAFGSY